jgi:hypothetical protein
MWKKLHNEELSDLRSIPSIVKGDQNEKNDMDGGYSMYGGRRGVNRVLEGKPDGKRPLGRPRRRWEDNIQMDLSGRGLWGHGLD